MRIFLSLMALILVSGCLNEPSAMPSGSYRAQEKHKSTDGPVARDIGYAYTVEENEKVLRMWEDVVASLVDQLETKGLGAQDVYIVPKFPENAFFLTYDHVLRQELRARGYGLVNDVRGIPVISFDAQIVPKDGSVRVENPVVAVRDEGYGKRVMSISVMRGGNSLASVKALHTVPLYGYHNDMVGAYGFFFENTGKGE